MLNFRLGQKLEGSQAHKKEQGAVILIVAIAVAAILSLVALSIDSNVATVSKEQGQQYAKLAALAAVEGYFASANGINRSTGGVVVGTSYGPPPSVQERLVFAIERAQLAIAPNKLLAENNSAGSTGTMVLDDSSVTPGLWTTNTTQCTNSGLTAPCFISAVVGGVVAGNGQNINAFKIEGNVYPDGIKYWFARNIFGTTTSNLHVSAVATVVPRRGCFVVDASGSMVQETHQSPEDIAAVSGGTPNPSNRTSRYAFYLGPATATGCQAQVPPPIPLLDPTSVMPLRAERAMWNEMDPVRGTNSFDPTIHYRDDYRVIQTYGHNDFDDALSVFETTPDNTPHSGAHQFPFYRPGSAGYLAPVPLNDPNPLLSVSQYLPGTSQATSWNWNPSYPTIGINVTYDNRGLPTLNPVYAPYGNCYAVDTYTNPTENYYGPEPLTTVFAGLHSAIQAFRARQVAGDQACIIFYDQSLEWQRVIHLTDDFDYLLAITDFKNEDPYQITPTTSGGDGGGNRSIILRHSLFPGIRGSTNMASALMEARNQLYKPTLNSAPTADFITMIGDGFGNCLVCPSMPTDYRGSTEYGGRWNNCTPGNECSQNFLFHMVNKAQLGYLVTQPQYGLRALNIPLNFIMVGKTALPSTYDIPKLDDSTGAPTGQCVSDLEFRSFTNADKGRYAPYLNAELGAVDPYAFVPSVRRSLGCAVDTNNPRNELTNYVEAFNNMSPSRPYYQINRDMYAIAAAARGFFFPIRPRAPEGSDAYSCPPLTGTPPSGRSVNPVPPCMDNNTVICGGSGDTLHHGLEGTPQLDRLRTTDPYCRTTAEQMQDYMGQILQGNPYNIVRVEVN